MPNVGEKFIAVMDGLRFAWGVGVGVVAVVDPPPPPPQPTTDRTTIARIERFGVLTASALPAHDPFRSV
jgi:hypothetical protein